MEEKRKPQNFWEWIVWFFARLMVKIFPKVSIKCFTKWTNPYAEWFLQFADSRSDGYSPFEKKVAERYPFLGWLSVAGTLQLSVVFFVMSHKNWRN